MSNTSNKRFRAYEDSSFLHSPDARALRILAEYIEPNSRFKHYNIQDTIIFFGSARISESSAEAKYYEEARTLARELTSWATSLANTGSDARGSADLSTGVAPAAAFRVARRAEPCQPAGRASARRRWASSDAR